MLNGGLRAWLAAGYPVSDAPPAVTSSEFTRASIAPWRSMCTECRARLATRAIVLVDARPADRFAGRNETIDPVAGHVPGARNHPFMTNLDAERRFLPPLELRGGWLRTLAGAPGERVVCMCGSGVTACHDLLALRSPGSAARAFIPGSWSEWIRDPSAADGAGRQPIANWALLFNLLLAPFCYRARNFFGPAQV